MSRVGIAKSFTGGVVVVGILFLSIGGIFSYLNSAHAEGVADTPDRLNSFGTNANGRTGLGTINGDTTTPTQIAADREWQAIAANFHSLAVKSDGTLWSFGNNSNGQTGQGTTTGDTTVPTQIGEDEDWQAVSAGREHSLALKTDGTLWSFGNNANGRTGFGTVEGTTNVPARIGEDSNWQAIAAGGSHSLAIS